MKEVQLNLRCQTSKKQLNALEFYTNFKESSKLTVKLVFEISKFCFRFRPSVECFFHNYV